VFDSRICRPSGRSNSRLERPGSTPAAQPDRWADVTLRSGGTFALAPAVIGSCMASPAREVESRALRLPRRERARLAQRLISSLDQEVNPDVDKLWLQEAERRLRELKSGKVAGIPTESVVRKARSTLR
jgi:putative addiction module component (TIGR02574 family)